MLGRAKFYHQRKAERTGEKMRVMGQKRVGRASHGWSVGDLGNDSEEKTKCF